MKRNYIYTIVLTVFNILFPILSFPYISRILGPDGVGKTQFVITFSQYFALVAALGIPYYGVREIARVKGNKTELSKTFSELIGIYVLTSLIVSVIYIAVVFIFPRFSGNLNYYIPSLLIILLGFSSIDWFYQGIEEFRSIALRSIVVKLVSLISMYAFVKTTGDAVIYLYITIFSILGNNILNLLLLRGKVNLTFHNLNTSKHLKPLLLIFGANLSVAMYNMLDIVLLGLLSDDKAVGYYTAGTKITRIALPLVISIGSVLLPKISESFHTKTDGYKKLLATSYSFTIFLAVPISVGLYLLAPELVYLVSGPEFTAAIIPMKILSVLPLLIGMGNLFGVQVLISSGKDAEMLKSVMVGMVVSILLNLIMVPKMHEMGAAIANSITELIVSACFYYYVRKSFNIVFPIKIFLYSVAATLPFIPIIYLLRKTIASQVLFLGGSFVLCGIVYLLIKYFILKDEHTAAIAEKMKGTIFEKLGFNSKGR